MPQYACMCLMYMLMYFDVPKPSNFQAGGRVDRSPTFSGPPSPWQAQIFQAAKRTQDSEIATSCHGTSWDSVIPSILKSQESWHMSQRFSKIKTFDCQNLFKTFGSILEQKFHGKTFRTSADLAQAPKGECLLIWLTEDGDSLSLPDAVAKFKRMILFAPGALLFIQV